MLWFYCRESDTLRVETRFDNQTAEYVLIAYWPDGKQEERFATVGHFKKSLVQLETRLANARWTRGGPPVILPDGWPHKRPRR
jgi:hypothetical protein